MLAGFKAFKGQTQFILSGEDLVAKEFQQLCKADKAWNKAMRGALQCHVAKANHTFSTAEWRAEAERRTIKALRTMRI
jgi:uncharacterized protein Usg